jgi:hypothetical protein
VGLLVEYEHTYTHPKLRVVGSGLGHEMEKKDISCEKEKGDIHDFRPEGRRQFTRDDGAEIMNVPFFRFFRIAIRLATSGQSKALVPYRE